MLEMPRRKRQVVRVPARQRRGVRQASRGRMCLAFPLSHRAHRGRGLGAPSALKPSSRGGHGFPNRRRKDGAAPTVRSIPAQGKPATRAPPWVPSPKRLAPHRGVRNRSLRLLPGTAPSAGFPLHALAMALSMPPPIVPSAPIGRTAMGRLTQGGARVAGLPWAGIPAHRWCGRGHQTCNSKGFATSWRLRGGGVRMRPLSPFVEELWRQSSMPFCGDATDRSWRE